MQKHTVYAFLILFFLISADILAIPAFARKYRMSCQTCHAPVPRLKAYGDSFAGNGFMLEDAESPRYFMETGDDKLSLIRDYPLAVRFDAFATYRVDDGDNKGEFRTPYLMKLLSGGNVARDVAYYFYFYMNEKGDVVGVEDAYLMFNNLLGVDLDLYVGQFQVSDPLFKRELRLTLEDYQTYKVQPGLSHADLTYDRGLMLTYGLPTGTSFIFEVVNGNGLSNAEEKGFFDNDNYKNLVGRVSQDIGDFFRIGGFVYWGKEDLQRSESSMAVTNEMLIYGPDASLAYEDIFELNLQYLIRNDDNMLTSSSETPLTDTKVQSGLAELIITPNGDDSDLYGVLMYNIVDSEDYRYLDYKTVTGHLGYMLRRNLRLVGEVRYDIENDFTLLSVGFVSAF